MGKFIKVKVNISAMLIDPNTPDPKDEKELFKLDYPELGSVHQVPDNPFWRRKCFEDYLDFVGEVKDKQVAGPWDGLSKTDLEKLALEGETKVDLKGCKNKADIIAKLEEAGVEPLEKQPEE